MIFRSAKVDDLAAIIGMLANDPLGKLREKVSDPIDDAYLKALQNIDADENQELIVLEIDGQIVGTMQLTFLQYLNRMGSLRMQIESVRVHSDFRGQRIGTAMFEWAIDRAKERNVQLVQLTTDKQRPEALRFYEGFGFVASHEGMKLHLE